MTDISLTGTYVNGQTADATDVQADFDAIESFLNSIGVHIYQSGSVIAAALAADAVTTAKIAAGSVTTAKIADSGVTTVKIADSNVTTAKIADSNVTTAKIADGGVTTSKIAAAAVTFSQLADDSVAPRNVARVAAVSDSNVGVSSPGTSSIGGATVVSGETVLLAAQSTASQNGYWTFNGSGSAMTRPTWYDGSGDAFEGSKCVCLRGTYAGREWRLTTTGTITVDSTSTSFKMVGYFGSGNTASRPAIALVSDGLYVDSEASIVYYAESGTWTALPIATGSVGDGAITTAKLADSSVTTGKVADDSIGPRQRARIAAVHTSNVNTSNPGTSTFGGATVIDNAGDGEFVLLVGQSTSSQNGPWQFNGSGAAMTRPAWYDGSSDAFEGMRFDVIRGDWAQTVWRLALPLSGTSITIGTTATTWKAIGYVGRGSTASRPSAALIHEGGLYFDTTTGQLLRSDGGSSWVELIDTTDLTDHINDASAAHAASAISVNSATLVGTGTDVQAVFEEIDNSIADHMADAAGAHAASAISFSPASGIAATDVQAAIVEAIADWQSTYDDLNIGKIYPYGGPLSGIPDKHIACYGQDLDRTTYADLFERWCPIVGGVATGSGFSITTTTAHGLTVGDAVFIEHISGSGGAELVEGAQYYVRAVSETSIHLCETQTVDAPSGVTTAGEPLSCAYDGTFYVRHSPHGISGTSDTPDTDTFKCIDLRRSTLMGLGNMGGSSRSVTGHSWVNVLGLFAGEATHTLTSGESGQKASVVTSEETASWADVDNAFSFGITAHDHDSVAGYSFWVGASSGGNSGLTTGSNRFQLGNIASESLSVGINPSEWNALGGYQIAHSHTMSGSSASSGHNNIQPSTLVSFITYTGVPN